MDASLPDGSTFFAVLHPQRPREDVAALYRALGWRVRRCGHEAFELTCPWADLVLDGDGPLLLHGPVADGAARLEEVVAPLRQALIGFRAEAYGAGSDRPLRVVEG